MESYLLIAMVLVALVSAFFTAWENVMLRRRLDHLQSPMFQAGPVRYPLSVIDRYRNAIAKAFPPQFVSQFSPAEFNRMVEERLRTALAHGQPTITRDGRPEIME
jgi:hypothetical protein